MILDRLADLGTLAERASSAASTLTEDAAFADVQGQVTRARSLFAELGIARAGPLSLLTDVERRAVVQSGVRMRQALEVISAATDEELAAYASAAPDKRGSLLAVSRQASALRTELISAQQTLLQRLAGEIWPESDFVRLDIISYFSDDPVLGETVRRAERVHQRLRERALATDVGLAASEVDALIEEATRAAVDAQQLRAEPIPDDVVEFWQDASSEDGASLTKLPPTVWQWLEKHQALVAFTIYRTR